MEWIFLGLSSFPKIFLVYWFSDYCFGLLILDYWCLDYWPFVHWRTRTFFMSRLIKDVPMKSFSLNFFYNLLSPFFIKQVDVDDNGHQDFLVGAILSEEAVILRSLKVIEVTPMSYAIFPSTALNPKLQSKRQLRVL